MASAILAAGQGDFGAGMVRGREPPGNAIFDAVNMLIDADGQLFRRGGSEYKTTSDAGATLLGIADVFTRHGPRTLVWTATNVYVLAADDVSVVNLGTTGRPSALSRAFGMQGLVVFNGASLYAGSRKATYSTGTVSVTNGSTAVTGSGTAWLANADGGMFLVPLGGVVDSPFPPVESINSDTSLTLTEPWPFATNAARTYNLSPLVTLTPLVAPPGGGSSAPVFVATVGTLPRILFAQDNFVHFTPPGVPWFTDAGDVHQMPAAAQIVGLDAIADTALVFTTAGVWAIADMNFDEIDDAGNIQHRVEQINELVLWGDSGIAKYRGAAVVPAIDNVWLMPLGEAPIPIGEGIGPLLQGHVKAGYQPGTASVHRGHYILPIVNGTTWVDTLVCRLDREFAWTRWSGHGAGIAYAQRVGSASRSSKLLSISGQRVTDLSDAWSPSASNASEADGSTHSFRVDTRDYPTPGVRPKGATTRKVRLRYEAAAAGAVTVSASYARGPEGAAFTSLGSPIRGGGVSDGLDESVWPVAKQAPAIRFRLESASALSSFTLREITAQYS